MVARHWCDSRADGIVRMKEGVCKRLCVDAAFHAASSDVCLHHCPEVLGRCFFVNERHVNEHAVQQAIDAASHVRGRTSPNPAVGAVVVRDGQVIASGATQPPGAFHAEREALRAAGSAARGADLYVTLEPCTFHGRTPPCTDAIIAAGIARVFYAVSDPDPRMGGGAITVLRDHGIACTQIDCDDMRLQLQLAPFFMRIQHDRPWVTWKYAMSLDGKIATHTGTSQWISSGASRAVVHALRDTVDAIMTGSGTVCADNPQLTVRIPGRNTTRQPLRVVVDSRGVSPLTATIFETHDAATVVFCTSEAPYTWQQELVRRGVRVICHPHTGHVHIAQALEDIRAMGINHVLLEAGAGLAGACADADLIDEIHCFIAPGLIGNPHAPSPLGGTGITTLIDWQSFQFVDQQIHGSDVQLHAVHRRIKTLFHANHQGVTVCLPGS